MKGLFVSFLVSVAFLGCAVAEDPATEETREQASGVVIVGEAQCAEGTVCDEALPPPGCWKCGKYICCNAATSGPESE
jgi:hypothetical protein